MTWSMSSPSGAAVVVGSDAVVGAAWAVPQEAVSIRARRMKGTDFQLMA